MQSRLFTRLSQYFLMEELPLTDGEIAKKLEVHINSVQSYRKKHGIPSNFERLKDKYLNLLVMYDNLAEVCGTLEARNTSAMPIWLCVVLCVATSILTALICLVDFA